MICSNAERSGMRVLILGGTQEASTLAHALATDPRYAPVLSLAGRTRDPRLPPIPVRIGGFGGADGLAHALHAMRAEALIDATHPFAARISANAARAAALAEVPLLAIHRPEWRPGEADRWTMLPDLTAAAAALGEAPRRVFLTIGKQELAPFRATRHRYVVRSVEPPDPGLLPSDCTVIAARGPFAEADERRLLMEHGIEVIVTKNSGGTATRAKLDAARVLGIPVLMIQRPPPGSEAESVETADDALRWLAARHSARRGV
jgi:precorrin-6A/cobalt-precorrin-6A reductase